MIRDRDERPQEDPLAVHCFCVCSGSAQLGDLGVSRSIKCDFLSFLSYPKFFSSVSIKMYFNYWDHIILLYVIIMFIVLAYLSVIAK